jgi:uncharacterized membrane protein
MARRQIKKIATAGILSAVVIVLGLTGLGLIIWPSGLAITILHIPVIIGAVLEGPLVGLFIGFLFGIFSLIQSTIIAVPGTLDVVFINPLISILPRLFIGPAAWLVYVLISGKLFGKNSGPADGRFRIFTESLAIAAAGVIGSLANTILVLSALAVFKHLPWIGIPAVVLTNGLPEAVAAALIVLAVVSAWKHIPRRGGRSRLSGEQSG